MDPSGSMWRPAARRDGRHRSWRRGAILVSAALLTVAVGCGGGDDDASTDAGADLGETVGSAASTDATSTSTTTTTSTTAPTTTTTPPPTTVPSAVPLAITDVSVPDTSPDGIDACSQPTSYDAANLTDGLTDSAWRMPGDATGGWITFHLDGDHRVLGLAVLPGYAKVDPCDGADRWSENRRPVAVTWQFDDGTQVAQALEDSATVQEIVVDATTTTISLRIDGVTAAPPRDFTAISEVVVYGT